MDNFNSTKGNILVIDDDTDISNIFRINFERQGHVVHLLSRPRGFLDIIRDRDVDTVLLDIMMPESSGFEVLKQIRQQFPHVPVIMITALQSIDPAVAAMKLGAYDYILKPEGISDFDHLNLIIRNSIAICQSVKELNSLRENISKKYRFENIIGTSQHMKNIFEQIKKVADSNINVLIYGESGTGKELVARAIHYNSSRREAPFADMNCAAVPENLIESELFGHEKGAFTGAHIRKIGKFEHAHTGTLFLDEIGDMPLTTQAKILRVTQELAFERLGGREKIKVDVRLISATNKNLQDEVKEKKFREDLYYRLSAFPIYLPPLRERVEDIPALASHFILKFAREMNKLIEEPSAETLLALKTYYWPGNIRELENVIQRAVVLADRYDKKLNKEYLPLEIQKTLMETDYYEKHDGLSSLTIRADKILSFEEIEKRILTEALMFTNGNVSQAAEELKIGRATIYRKIEKYGLKHK